MSIITKPKRIILGQRLASDYASSAPPTGPSDPVSQSVSKGQNAPLGIYAKSSSPQPPLICDKLLKNQNVRNQKLLLQNDIRKFVMLNSGFSPSDIIDLDDYNSLHRVVKCVRGRVTPNVEVKKSTNNGKAFYKGLFTCGSVWACPVCSSKIQEVRRKEISTAVDWGYENDFMIIMVTFTFPHNSFQKPSDLLLKQSAAFKSLRSGKAFDQFKKAACFQGLIRSLEITHGSNGWHPHTHELWFLSKETDRQFFEDFLINRWENSCSKQGLIPRGKLKAFRKRAVNFRWNCSTSDYLAKQDDDRNFWGIDREMSSPSSKFSDKTVHPFQLIHFANLGDENSAHKFIEYIEAMKGKAQIFWSRGFKKRVGVIDSSDSEIAEQTDDDPIDISELDIHAWNVVLDKKARSLILNLAEKGGREAIDDWLSSYGLNSAAYIPVFKL